MLQYISRSLSQSHFPALSWLVNDLYQDAVSWGSPRDQVSLVKRGGGGLARCLGARKDLPGGVLQVENCAPRTALRRRE